MEPNHRYPYDAPECLWYVLIVPGSTMSVHIVVYWRVNKIFGSEHLVSSKAGHEPAQIGSNDFDRIEPIV